MFQIHMSEPLSPGWHHRWSVNIRSFLLLDPADASTEMMMRWLYEHVHRWQCTRTGLIASLCIVSVAYEGVLLRLQP